MINAGMPQFASRLAMMVPIEEPPWRESLAEARAEKAMRKLDAHLLPPRGTV